MGYLFTSESVSEGHPDKVADRISDGLLDEFLRWDPNSKVACETMVTTGLVVCAGEVRTTGYVDIESVARRAIAEIGYTKAEYRFDSNSCGVISTIHEQSSDIHQGVERANEEEQGAGDQGMMFGYACDEMDNYMPVSSELAHILVQELAAIRKEGLEMTYLRPDSKSQVTVEYNNEGSPIRIDTLVVSTQHDEFVLPKDDSAASQKEADNAMHAIISKDISEILLPRVMNTLPENIQDLFAEDTRLFVNPTGKFVIGGPHGDTGLTGRKIIVDTYGGNGAHGGGAFSGKDASKVDRSAAYAARHIAKNMVAAGIARKVLVQVAYAIGIANPVGLFINTYGTAQVNLTDGEIAQKINELFDMRPYAIVKRFGLKNPIYAPTSAYGHFGRDYYEAEVPVYYTNTHTTPRLEDGKEAHFKKVEFFTWEKLDYIEPLKKAFGLS